MRETRDFKLAGVTGLLFIILIILVRMVDVDTIGPDNSAIGLSHVNKLFHDLTGFHQSIYDLTDILGKVALLVAAVMALTGLIQMIRRRSLKEVDKEIIALGMLYILVGICYAFFEVVIINYRPMIMEGETALEASFPSSHTMLSCVILGSAMLLMGRYMKEGAIQTFLKAVFLLLIIVTVVGRLICGVHWLTDILGGVLLSITLLLLFSGILKNQRPRYRFR